jgi:hypothetical protein
MKGWLLLIGIAIATFGLGCGIYFLSGPARILYWKAFGPLSYCEVARNAGQYHNTNVLVRARIIFDESGVYVYDDCDPVEALAASVVINGHHPLIGPEYVEKLLVQGEQRHRKTADAVIEGVFDAEASSGCWAPKFRIEAQRIEIVSPIIDYAPAVVSEEGLRLKH